MISSLDDEKLDRKDGLALQKMLESDQSIYKLRKYFAKQGYGISYPSLYKRVKRLLKKRLIEESIMGKTIENIHGAIYYRLTLAGILYIIHHDLVINYDALFSSNNYKNNPLFEDLVLSVFEEKTLQKPPSLLRNFIIWHLEECASRIVQISKQIPKEEKIFHERLAKHLKATLDSQKRLLVIRLIMASEHDVHEFELRQLYLVPPLPLSPPAKMMGHLAKDQKFCRQAANIYKAILDGADGLQLRTA